jgi:hypothetical protein
MKLKIIGDKSLISQKQCKVISHYDKLALLYIATKKTIEDVQCTGDINNRMSTPGIYIDFEYYEDGTNIDFLDYRENIDNKGIVGEHCWTVIGLHHGSDYVYVTLSKEI